MAINPYTNTFLGSLQGGAWQHQAMAQTAVSANQLHQGYSFGGGGAVERELLIPGTPERPGLTLSEAKWRLSMIGMDPHPVMVEYVQYLLMGLAGSKDADARRMALAHRLLPAARVIFMQDDPDPELRAMAAARIAYEQQQHGE